MSQEQADQLNSQQLGANTPVDRPTSAAELCLYLIMVMPTPEQRIRYVKDFCMLYEIREKSPPALRSETQGLGRIIGSNK